MGMFYFIGFLELDKIYKSEENSVFVYRNSVFLASAKNKKLCLFRKSGQNLTYSK